MSYHNGNYADEILYRLENWRKRNKGFSPNTISLGTDVIDWLRIRAHLLEFDVVVIGGKVEQVAGCNVIENKKIPYIIDFKYIPNKKDDLIKKIMFTKEEEHILKDINLTTKAKIDEDLKDLKVWIKYGEYLENAGEDEDLD